MMSTQQEHSEPPSSSLALNGLAAHYGATANSSITVGPIFPEHIMGKIAKIIKKFLSEREIFDPEICNIELNGINTLQGNRDPHSSL